MSVTLHRSTWVVALATAFVLTVAPAAWGYGTKVYRFGLDSYGYVSGSFEWAAKRDIRYDFLVEAKGATRKKLYLAGSAGNSGQQTGWERITENFAPGKNYQSKGYKGFRGVAGVTYRWVQFAICEDRSYHDDPCDPKSSNHVRD
jgi:hypothetical protein